MRKESGTIDKSALEAHLKDTYIDVLDLSILAYNGLRRSGIITLADLDATTPKELMKIRNLGRKGCEEIINKYRKYKEEKERELVKRKDSKQDILSEVELENMTLEQLQNIIDENKQKIENSGNIDVDEERECLKTIIKAQSMIISKYKDVISHSVNEQRGT